jgi:hypothetical protein
VIRSGLPVHRAAKAALHKKLYEISVGETIRDRKM